MGEAYLPHDLARAMIDKGLVTAGPDTQNPKPEWTMNNDGSHGAAKPLFHRYCTEITTEGQKP